MEVKYSLNFILSYTKYIIISYLYVRNLPPPFPTTNINTHIYIYISGYPLLYFKKNDIHRKKEIEK